MKALVVLVALVAATSARADTPRGYALYGQYCAECHSVAGKAPSLRGTGARAADFYLRTGYMPLVSPDDQPWRKRPLFTEREIRDLVAYAATLGGPPVPKPHPARGNLSEGMQAFTEHCAGCHQVLAQGGMVSGARVPSLGEATPTQIAEAVRIGPYLMPRFTKQQLPDGQLDSIIRYVQYARSPKDAGGWGIGHIGPVPEGLVAWLIAGAALVASTFLLGRRVRR